MFLGIRARQARKADNLTAIFDPALSPSHNPIGLHDLLKDSFTWAMKRCASFVDAAFTVTSKNGIIHYFYVHTTITYGHYRLGEFDSVLSVVSGTNVALFLFEVEDWQALFVEGGGRLFFRNVCNDVPCYTAAHVFCVGCSHCLAVSVASTWHCLRGTQCFYSYILRRSWLALSGKHTEHS
jgi:hypothetical protein